MSPQRPLKTWRPDPLITLILIALILAILAPARGDFAQGFSLATKLAIGLLFFLYGARLSPQEALQGLKHWQLHSTILAFTFILFPLIGLALYPLQAVIGRELYLGLLFMTLVPSTVQSSVAFTSLAKGNVAGAIVSASASNLAGVVLTPLLVMLLMRSDQLVISGSVFGNIAIQLLLPFILGQLLRRWVGEIARNKLTKHIDRLSIAMVVYAAFSDGIVQGIWRRISPWQILFLVVLSLLLVEFLLWLSGVLARKLDFSYGDRVAIQFCGSKKSLATGLPMAAVIFGGAQVGALILPLMIFHQVQLMVCAAKAARWGRQAHETP
ncbi:bile acid:sodium symporter family protein [Rothia sp. CCM 9416]|uniref:bile acid:sodium symporter family protein n=1 Tax=Rothia sp. CCM 9416 TaxID=3402655 RepID=UPI003AE0BC1B